MDVMSCRVLCPCHPTYIVIQPWMSTGHDSRQGQYDCPLHREQVICTRNGRRMAGNFKAQIPKGEFFTVISGTTSYKEWTSAGVAIITLKNTLQGIILYTSGSNLCAVKKTREQE